VHGDVVDVPGAGTATPVGDLREWSVTPAR
jgi:hypothetical protein